MSDDKDTKLDCLLVAPPMFYGNEENIWKQISSNFPPLGLASIAGYVRSKGRSVKIIDCNIVSPTVDRFEEYFEQEFARVYSSIGLIGLTATTGMVKKAYELAKICKKYFPQARIAFGGVHTTFLPEEILAHDFIDLAVIGEGELTTQEILAGKPKEDIKGIAYREIKDGKTEIIYTEPRPRILDLDALPMPAYDLLPIERYKPAKGSYKRLPAMNMMTSRGCPGRCTFCAKTLGLTMVFLSAEKIFEQIKYLMANYGIRQILFYDDTFTVYKANVIKLCDLLVANKVDLTWTCFARVDYIDKEMLLKMRQAGCHQIMYGVENVDDAVLKNINKKINPEQVRNAVRWTKEAGIECRLAFMVGNPGDTRETVRNNSRFINELDPDLVVINITTPFPGTEMFKWAQERGLLLSHDWDDFDLAKPVMRLENMSAAEIKDCYREMYRSFYLRPGYILKRLIAFRTIEDVKAIWSGFLAVLSFTRKKSW
jgi:radical SAM superfamily enzyme YgiQ (UPF0313 family)